MSPTWAVMEYGWYPFLVFIATPYFLHTLGPEQYGNWMLLTATVSLGAVLNVGTGAATVKQVSAGCGLADRSIVERTVRSSVAIALLGGGVLAALIFAVFTLAGDAIFGKMGERSLISLTGTVAALLAWIEQVDNVFASALKGGEQFGRAARIEIAGRTAQIGAGLLAATLWNGLTALYASLVLIAGMRLIVKSSYTKKCLGLSSINPWFGDLKVVLLDAKWGWLQSAGGLFFGIADRILVGSLLGAASLTHYSVATQLAQQIHAMSAAGLSVLFPKVSRKLAEDAKFSLWHITKISMGGNLLTSSFLAVGLLVFGRTLLSLWLGDAEAEASADVLWYLTIAYWLLAINVAPHFMLLGVGRMRFVAISNLAAGIVSLVTMIAVVRPYGLVGVSASRIVYGVIILVNYLSLKEYIWRQGGKPAVQAHTKPLVETI